MPPWVVVDREGLADDARIFRTLVAQVCDGPEPAPDADCAAEASEHAVLAFLAPNSAGRPDLLARQLLAYAGCLRLDPAPLELLPVLCDLAHTLRRALDHRIEVLVEVGHDCPRCHADRDALEEALLNLVANARHAMPDGGRLWLRAHACDLPDARPGVEVSVSDTGAGMSADALERAGQPFFTTQADRPLAGMGLAATNGFARCSGGVLALRTSPPGGSTAALRLPQPPASERVR